MASEERERQLRRQRQEYRTTPNGRRQKRRWKTKTRSELRDFIRSMKERPCADCGGTFDPVCMDFDHRPGEVKIGTVSRLALTNLDAVLAEIKKCDLVCSNCHRIRTFRLRDCRAPTSIKRSAVATQMSLELTESKKDGE